MSAAMSSTSSLIDGAAVVGGEVATGDRSAPPGPPLPTTAATPTAVSPTTPTDSATVPTRCWIRRRSPRARICATERSLAVPPARSATRLRPESRSLCMIGHFFRVRSELAVVLIQVLCHRRPATGQPRLDRSGWDPGLVRDLLHRQPNQVVQHDHAPLVRVGLA